MHQYLDDKSSKLQSVEGRGRKNSQYSKPEKVLVLISSEGVFPVTAFFTIIETFFLRKVFVESKFRLNRKLLPRGSGSTRARVQIVSEIFNQENCIDRFFAPASHF